MRTQSLTLAITTLLATLITATNAHEFWIQTSRVSTAQGPKLEIKLMHGHRFDGHPLLTDEPQIHRFEIVHAPDDSTDIPYAHRQSVTHADAHDTGIIVYESNLYRSNLSAERFEAYLKEEHLDHVIADRALKNETNKEGRELYARCSKSILSPEDPSKTSASIHTIDHAVGLPLEIIIESIQIADNHTNSADEPDPIHHTVTARVLHNGSPAADLRTVATSSADPDTLLELTTDSDGRIEFQTDLSSEWMITTLHIKRLTERQSEQTDADWISYWSSITF
ncbi:MAG: DUF4198 domain-containing protein [Phycisphaerales bacterium]|nr:DUF4198 domain-containing protein [Phycisphaerales bacterium]